MKTLTVRNVEQAALFEHELKGQISDGAWENTPGDHWQPWCDATVKVAAKGESLGRDFSHPHFRPYNFARKDLLDVVGDRMLELARQAGGNPNYTMTMMRRDLRDLSKIIRVRSDRGL